MIIDAHAHYHPRRFTEAVTSIHDGIDPSTRFQMHPVSDSDDDVKRRLELMDEAGVRLQVLSPAAGVAPYGPDEALAVEAARIANDQTAELVARYPDRFRAYVSLPLPHIEASLRELERGLDALGMIGVNLHIAALDRSVAEDEFLPIYEEINRRKGLIFYHPCANGICSPFITDYGFNSPVGTSLEDTVIVLHLIAKQLPAKYPDITYVVPHFGGLIPMLLERLDNQFPMVQRLPEPPSVTARRFYYDSVGHGSRAALICALEAFGADHILAGSDYPVLLAYESYARTFSWIAEAGLSPADATQILEKTAPAVLGLAV